MMRVFCHQIQYKYKQDFNRLNVFNKLNFMQIFDETNMHADVLRKAESRFKEIVTSNQQHNSKQ